MTKGKLILTPIVNSKSDMGYTFGDDHLEGSFWTKNAILKHDYMQLDSYNGMNFCKTRDDIRARDRVFIFSSTVGKKLTDALQGKIKSEKVSQNVQEKLTASQVINWQISVADAGNTLGIPAYNSNCYTTEFNNALRESAANAKVAYCIKERLNEEFKLFAYIDGTIDHDINKWFTTIHDAMIPDGYSFSGKSALDPNLLLIKLGYMIEHYNGLPLHITGSMNMEDIYLMAYANKYMNTNIYFDTLLHLMGKYKNYAMFFDFPRTVKLDSWNQHFECPCSACRFADNIEPKYHEHYNIFIALHNLSVSNWITKAIISSVENNIETPFTKSETIQYGKKFLDHVAEHGFDSTYNRYIRRVQNIKEWM